ncbi:pyruvate kinase [Paenibacillus yanchengensis]|uniref:Pyruvate kinase n=1 Tax=Paenibacillus yanchengensis TaxID=2035833 RepID=A0ABW4YQL2_9BACL
MNQTKIVCTMGPACQEPEILQNMMKAGMTVARLNMAHGDLKDHEERINAVRAAAEQVNAVVAIMMDIKGPEIRIGTLQQSSYELVAGNLIALTSEVIDGTNERVSVNYPDLAQAVKPGDHVLLDDGLIELMVESASGSETICRVINGGQLKPRKGVNLPGIITTLPGVTERDKMHIQFGIEQKIDMIAMSFVRRAEDVLQVKDYLAQYGAEHIQIISKIENEEGVDNLDAIIAASDGIMVARGDLGVEIPPQKVPLLQKEMIDKCNTAGKPVIVATQMLDSMQVNPRPTRAEVSDVANAVLQGADAIMLSGETAAGKYPLQSVEMMAAIAASTEATIKHEEQFVQNRNRHSSTTTETICQAVVASSLQLGAKAIITPTESGFSARMVSKYKPKAPIIAITAHDHVMKRLSLVRGVIPVKGESVTCTDDLLSSSINKAQATGLVQTGDYVVISAGVPIGQAGATNLIRIHEME